ncbi:MAG: hypothetical protein FIB02_06845 [Desulfuromonas sp.]|nr:hypothetical protein [Desulfuromonas sp.]
MKLEITEQEKALLLEMLEAKNTAMFHELHHTFARDYKDYVRQRMELLEGLKAKVAETSTSSGVAA